MGTTPPAVTSIDDDHLVALIKASTRRLVFMSPGLSLLVAKAMCNHWPRLGKEAVNVVLDVTPDVCRLGYGSIEAVRLLQDTAQQIRTAIHHQPGLRIGLIISDDTILIFTPTPLLIEAGSTQQTHPNAIRLDSVPPSIAKEIGPENERTTGGAVGREQVSSAMIEEVAKDLTSNPPVKFDVARKIHVFNAQFEFVEFSLRGCAIARRTVPIPSDLMGLANDPKTQKLLRSSFQLIGDDSELSGERVQKLRQYIASRYLITLKGYGNVIQRANKPAFETAIRALQRYVTRFQRRVEAKLQKAIDANRSTLVAALTPAVIGSPPPRWTKYLGANASATAIKEMLDSELASKFGTAKDYISRMEVALIFKGVTYELLNDPQFIEGARQAMPAVRVLHEEFDAARASGEQGALDNFG